MSSLVILIIVWIILSDFDHLWIILGDHDQFMNP